MHRFRGDGERRFTPRAHLIISVRLRPAERPELPEQQVESLNISRLGMYFESSSELAEGTTVEMNFNMPSEISGKREELWRCRGRVIRVDRKGMPPGKLGVGVKFDYYERLSA